MQSSKRRAWLTPDTEDALAELVCKRIFVPDAPAFRQSVSGALLELTHSWNWEQSGTMTPDETAALMLEYYNEYMLNGTCEGGGGIAPFWDDEDAEDSDDTEPEEPTFEWYEDLADWAVTAFLAVSFTPDAAIQFVTTARQIRFAFRKRDYGAIFRVLWDNVEVATVDTYSPTPAADVFSYFAPSASEHTLRIEHTGTYNPAATPTEEGYAIEIVRGALRVVGVQVRYNETNDVVEFSPDGGATWETSPENDRRNTMYLPPRTGSNPRCDAAANLTANLETWIDAEIVALQAGAAIATIVAIIVEKTPLGWGFWGLILRLLELLAAALMEVGAAALDAAFTPTTYATLYCIFYCHMDSQGRLTPTSIAAVEAEIFLMFGVGTVYNVMRLLIQASGHGAFNDWAATGDLVGDCSGCDCENPCEVFDFTTSNEGFRNYSWSFGQTYSPVGVWESGVGWKAQAAAGLYQIGLIGECEHLQANQIVARFYTPVNSVASLQIRRKSTGVVVASAYNNNTGAGNASVTISANINEQDMEILFGMRGTNATTARLYRLECNII